MFVDENLDRSVPISKQPKDKIQGILEACDRQFPEFHDRARKRVRTYLKSCRRMKRTRESNGWENVSSISTSVSDAADTIRCLWVAVFVLSQFRPTPPHLTSPIAEGFLRQACENESENAKRMRKGLDPLLMSPCSKMGLNLSAASSPNPKSHISAAATVSLPSFIPSTLTQTSSQPAHQLFPDWR